MAGTFLVFAGRRFLSSNAQDFIEEGRNHMENPDTGDNS